MPDENKDGKDGGGKTTAGAIEITLGDGTRKQFASVDELRESYLEAVKGSSTAATLGEENKRLSRIEKLAKAAVLVGTADAERQLYEELGVPSKEIARIMRSRDESNKDDDDDDDDDEEEEEERPVRRGRSGNGSADLEAVANRVLEKLNSRKISFRDWDEESFKYLEELVKRLDSATSVVKETSRQDIERSVASDKVIRDYWAVMSDRQKETAMKHLLASTGREVLAGKRPNSKQLDEMRGELRNYLTDVYGSAKELRGSRSVPTLLDLGEDVTGYEELSDKELSERIEELDTSTKPEHKGGAGLGARLRAAAESERRTTRR